MSLFSQSWAIFFYLLLHIWFNFNYFLCPSANCRKLGSSYSHYICTPSWCWHNWLRFPPPSPQRPMIGPVEVSDQRSTENNLDLSISNSILDLSHSYQQQEQANVSISRERVCHVKCLTLLQQLNNLIFVLCLAETLFQSTHWHPDAERWGGKIHRIKAGAGVWPRPEPAEALSCWPAWNSGGQSNTGPTASSTHPRWPPLLEAAMTENRHATLEKAVLQPPGGRRKNSHHLL